VRTEQTAGGLIQMRRRQATRRQPVFERFRG
jgi:hypothetical protein